MMGSGRENSEKTNSGPWLSADVDEITARRALKTNFFTGSQKDPKFPYLNWSESDQFDRLFFPSTGLGAGQQTHQLAAVRPPKHLIGVLIVPSSGTIKALPQGLAQIPLFELDDCRLIRPHLELPTSFPLFELDGIRPIRPAILPFDRLRGRPTNPSIGRSAAT